MSIQIRGVTHSFQETKPPTDAEIKRGNALVKATWSLGGAFLAGPLGGIAAALLADYFAEKPNKKSDNEPQP